MIEIVKGDLLLAKENLICHQVNCRGVMGSGLAYQVSKKYPHVFNEYVNLVDGQYESGGTDLRHTLLGCVQSVKIAQKQYIVNIFGQNFYGRQGKYTDTEALFKAFKQIRLRAEKLELSVAMPYKIGCYRGGADWEEVLDLLLTAFEGYKVTLYKHKEK